MQTSIAPFNRSLQKANHWLLDLCDIGEFDDEKQAYTALRAVLHELRDRLPLGEQADFGAQMPMIIRGLYYEGWDPDRPPTRVRHVEEFLARVAARLPVDWPISPDATVRSVFGLLRAYIEEGEIEDIRLSLPREFAQLWD